jgi:hypothetical protein
MADLFCGIVAGAIDFNGKSCGRAIEVENVGADGMLSAEAKAGQTSAAESLPEENFRQGHFRAQRARSFKGYDRSAHLPPPPRCARHLPRGAGEDFKRMPLFRELSAPICCCVGLPFGGFGKPTAVGGTLTSVMD